MSDILSEYVSHGDKIKISRSIVRLEPAVLVASDNDAKDILVKLFDKLDKNMKWGLTNELKKTKEHYQSIPDDELESRIGIEDVTNYLRRVDPSKRIEALAYLSAAERSDVNEYWDGKGVTTNYYALSQKLLDKEIKHKITVGMKERLEKDDLNKEFVDFVLRKACPEAYERITGKKARVPTYPSTKEVLDDFRFLYETYYLEKDERLTENAQKIKYAIAEILEGEDQEPKTLHLISLHREGTKDDSWFFVCEKCIENIPEENYSVHSTTYNIDKKEDQRCELCTPIEE